MNCGGWVYWKIWQEEGTQEEGNFQKQLVQSPSPPFILSSFCSPGKFAENLQKTLIYLSVECLLIYMQASRKCKLYWKSIYQCQSTIDIDWHRLLNSQKKMWLIVQLYWLAKLIAIDSNPCINCYWFLSINFQQLSTTINNFLSSNYLSSVNTNQYQ